ncbi:unnamed protein product [Symbiodinium microadriaticum]|nr:unnamed protein product [Symbiodinium microadriaticum]
MTDLAVPNAKRARVAKEWELPTCESCLQEARSVDRFSPDGAVLWWRKKGHNKAGFIRVHPMRKPAAETSSKVTRAKCFPDMTQDELERIKAESEELKKLWEEKRGCSCSGTSQKRRLSAVDLTTYKKEEQYTNFYQEGEVYTPSEFLLKKGYDPKRIGNEKKQIEFLNKELQVTVNKPNGMNVVIVLGQMKVKVGTYSGVGKQREESHEDGKEAATVFREETAGLASFRAGLQSEAAVDERIAEHQAALGLESEQTEAEMETGDVGCLDGHDDDEAAMDMEFEELVAAGKPCGSTSRQQSKDNKRGKLPKLGQLGSEGGSPGRSRKSGRMQLQLGDRERAVPTPPATPPSSAAQLGPFLLTPEQSGETVNAPGATVKPGIAKKALEMYESKRQAVSDLGMWQGKVKKRAVDQAVEALEKHAQKLLGDPSHQQLMDNMLGLVEWVPKKFSLLGALRKSPMQYVAELSEEDRECLLKLDPSLMSTIVIQTAGTLMKDMDQDGAVDLERVKTIMNLIAFEPAPNTTGLCLALYRSMLDDKHAGLLQTQVMMMTLDKIWRMKVDDKIRKVIGALQVTPLDMLSLPAEWQPSDLPVAGSRWSTRVAFEVQVARSLWTNYGEAGGTALENMIARAVVERKSLLMEGTKTLLRVAASQCITAASVSEECKRVLQRYPYTLVEEMKEKGDPFFYMNCLSTTTCADAVLAAKVCHAQLGPVSNSLETSGEEAKQLTTYVTEMAEIVKAMTPGVMGEIVQVMKDDINVAGATAEKQKALLEHIAEPAHFKNFCKIAKLFEVDGWSEMADTSIHTMGLAVADGAHVRIKTALAEAELTRQSFAVAAQVIHKLQTQSKAVKAANEFVEECNLSGLALPDKMKDIAVATLNIASKLQNRPVLWCKSLMQKGQTSALLALDASVRANVGTEAERLLRLAQVVEDAEKPKHQQSDLFALDEYHDKAVLSSCIVHVIELHAAISEGGECFDDARLRAASVRLSEKLSQNVMSMAQKMSELKTRKLAAAMPRLEPLQKAMKDNDRTVAEALCSQLNSETFTLECSKGAWAKIFV